MAGDRVELSEPVKKFIVHWGEMGTRWGINRTVAQIYALLFVSEKPLNAEQIAATLSVARSNVSTSLRELQSWRIVKITHIMGDRRDYFEAMKDVWETFRAVIEERKRREVDSTVQVLRDCTLRLAKTGSADAYARERLADLLDIFETFTDCYAQAKDMKTRDVIRLAKMANKFNKLLSMVSR